MANAALVTTLAIINFMAMWEIAENTNRQNLRETLLYAGALVLIETAILAIAFIAQ